MIQRRKLTLNDVSKYGKLRKLTRNDVSRYGKFHKLIVNYVTRYSKLRKLTVNSVTKYSKLCKLTVNYATRYGKLHKQVVRKRQNSKRGFRYLPPKIMGRTTTKINSSNNNNIPARDLGVKRIGFEMVLSMNS